MPSPQNPPANREPDPFAQAGAVAEGSPASGTPAPRNPVPQTPATRTFAILTAAACGMAALIALLPAAGHDQMWLLYGARLMLNGAKLYGPQIFETNPPLIFWLSAVPAALAGWLHLPDTALGKLLVLALACCAAWVCIRLAQSSRLAQSVLTSQTPPTAQSPHIPQLAQSARFSPAQLAWLAFVFVALFAVMPARDFGQRDHLVVLLCLPYIFAAAACAEGRPPARSVAILIGAAALVGIAMKPHQTLVILAVETTLILLRLRHGRPQREAHLRRDRLQRDVHHPLRSLLRPELLTLVLSGLLFLLAVQLFARDYFTVIIPLVRDTYWAFGQWSFVHLVTEAIQLHILAVLTLALFFAHGWRRASALICLLLAAGLASLVAYYVQGTGWYYQQLPSLTYFALALAFLLLDLAALRGLTMPRWAPAVATALSMLALGLTAHFTGYPFTAARSFPIDIPDPTLFTPLPPGAAVMTITTTVDYVMPPVYKFHLTLGQRYPHFVLLPAILRSEDPQGAPLRRHLSPARIAQLDAFQHQAMREDLTRWRPQLILVERCQDPAVHCQVLEDRHDNLLAWFLRDPGFRALFADYHYLRSAGPFDAYAPN